MGLAGLGYRAAPTAPPCVRPMSVLVCLCTCPDVDVAQRIADSLVTDRLAACVNVLPGVRSVYRWKGAVERADEVLLVIKTVSDRLPAVQARVQSLHPYELPELIAIQAAGGLTAYMDWLAEASRDASSRESLSIDAGPPQARTPTRD